MARAASRAAALALLALLSGLAARAVVIDTGDGTGNTTPPGDDFGFENVGVTATNLSGVYLGRGWVLTANHVGAQPITLLGTSYLPVEDTGVRLANDSGPAPDLYVYRIDGRPPLPSLALSSAVPSVGEKILCLGNGWNREASPTTWNLDWEPAPPPVYTGYRRANDRARRWGANQATAVGDDVEIVSGSGAVVSRTRSIETAFDDLVGILHESQAVGGDSGGGCFAKRSGTWELVGILFAVRTYTDPNGPDAPPAAQPGSTAVFGNRTFAADVAFYREQIEALTPPAGVLPAVPLPAAGALAAALALAGRRLRRTAHSRQR